MASIATRWGSAKAGPVNATSETPGAAQGAPGSYRRVALLALGALGIVYGDIGTSPLYSLRECFTGPHSVQPTPANALARS